MLTNDILRRVRYALDLSDEKVRALFELSGSPISGETLDTMFKKDDEPGFVRCPDSVAHLFFQGLIIRERGKPDENNKGPSRKIGTLENNDVLWYLRIAMKMKDEDVLAILKKAEVTIGKSELSAFFRKKDHENYRPCGDQFLRNFLAGFTATYRITK